jgi:hypothetical protein
MNRKLTSRPTEESTHVFGLLTLSCRSPVFVLNSLIEQLLWPRKLINV